MLQGPLYLPLNFVPRRFTCFLCRWGLSWMPWSRLNLFDIMKLPKAAWNQIFCKCVVWHVYPDRRRWWDAADACKNGAGSRDSFQSGDPQFGCSFCQGERSEGGGSFELVRLPFLKLLWKWFPRPLPVSRHERMIARLPQMFSPLSGSFYFGPLLREMDFRLSGWSITWNNHLLPVQFGSLELAFLHDSAEESF